MEARVAVTPGGVRTALSDAAAAHITTVVSLTSDGMPEVDLGADGRRVPARRAIAVTRERLETAITLGQQAVVLFENSDRSRPIIVGFIERIESPPPAAAPEEPAAPVIEADVDGKRVRVTAQEEIVLECGSASVTLRRNGRVIIRGTYVETRSEGTNRIKGGQVQIN
jgi:hypothetical protein